MLKLSTCSFFAAWLVCGMLLTPLLLRGQQLPSAREHADEFYTRMEYKRALNVYTADLSKTGGSAELYRKMADCYQHLGQYGKADTALKTLLRKYKGSPEDNYMLGRALESEKKYLEAKQYYTQFLLNARTSKLRPFAQERIRVCNFADSIFRQKSEYEVHNEMKLNSPFSDFGAFKTGNMVYFASDRPHDDRELKALEKGKIQSARAIYGWTGRPYLKIFSSGMKAGDSVFEYTLTGDSSRQVKTSRGIRVHTGPAVFSGDGKRMYFTRTSPGNTGVEPAQKFASLKDSLLSPKRKRLKSVSHLEIWFSDLSDGKWSRPKPFKFNSSRYYSAGHPALSPDGKTLYFSSDMPGSTGGMDIWKSEIGADGDFAKPVNLGKTINTSENELFPSMQADSTLFFSSNGRGGFGGLDIFRTKLTDGSWSAPENLGSPVNSAGDDFDFQAFGPRSDSGFLASNRAGGAGNDDIYSFVRLQPLLLKVFVRNLETKHTLYRADIRFSQEKTQESNFTGIEGYSFFKVSAGKPVMLHASHDGYTDTSSVYQVPVQASYRDTLVTTLYLKQKTLYREIDDIGLDKLYYDFDKSNIRADAVPILDRLTALLKRNPNLRIELSSHTDSRGSDAYNLKLSVRRAASAVRYLIAHGIQSNRLVPKGYGETMPVNECVNGVKCSDADFQLNRRTEIIILK